MILDENLRTEEELITLTDAEIFTRIWTSPRLVFKFLNENRYDKFVYPLLVLGGIGNAFDRAITQSTGENWPMIGVVAACIIFGGLFGWIANYIYAALLSWTGKWLGGSADTTQLLRVVAHAMIPTVAGMILLIPQIGFFGEALFQRGFDITDYSLMYVSMFYAIASLEFVLGIWSFVLSVVGISEVQKLNIGNAILNIILPVIILVVPIVVIIMLVRY